MKKQSFIKGSVILIASAVISKAIGALFKIPLTNMLGGSGMSSFSCAYGLFLPVYAVTASGLTTAMAKLTAENCAVGNYSNIRKIHKTALLLFCGLGALCSLLIFLLAVPFAEKAAACPDGKLAVMAIAPAILLSCFTAVYRGCREGMTNMYPTALSQVAESLIRLIAGLGLCCYVLQNPEKIMPYLPEGTTVPAAAAAAAVFGITLSTLGGAIFMYITGSGCEKLSDTISPVPDSSKKIVKDIMGIFLPVALGSVAANLTSVADLATIVRCLEKADRGGDLGKLWGIEGIKNVPEFIYGSFTGLAITIFNLVPSVTNMFGKGILPFISTCCAEKNPDGVKRLTGRVTAVTAFIALPCGMGIFALSKPILQFLFSERQAECAISSPSLAILGLGVIFLCLSSTLFCCFQAAGRSDVPVKLTLIGAAVKLAGNVLLIPIPRINIAGAAISTLLCYLVIFLLCLLLYPRTVGVNVEIKCLLPIGFSGILCALTAYIVYSLCHFANTTALPVAVAAGGAVYFISAFLTGGLKMLKSR